MPTARELLEQADALMRRNRSPAPDAPPPDGLPGTIDVPVPPPGMRSPRTIQREPIAPSAARTSLPVDPTESPMFAPGGDPPSAARLLSRPSPPAADRRIDDDIASARPKADAADAAGDDVPLLTDVVEEIDVGIVDEATQGEPSIWDIATRGEASVLGTVSPTISSAPTVVPPAAVPRTPPGGRDPLGLDQPAPGFVAPPSVQEAPSIDEAPAVEPVEPAEPVVVADEWNPVPEGAADVDASPSPADTIEPASAPLQTEADVARIREIAEEIGMQVLQRIDIFSDTTLPAQLGERLKPVVERASADLVAAINTHVGELLRAYIAEAISREIESWRNGGR